MINVEEVKQKMIAFLGQKGPSLPVHLAREVELSSMFASAIMGELLNEKRVKTSSLRVGASPLYLLPGQEPQLEKFAESDITGTDKEAFLLLKSKKILQDELQSPAIRVALRKIRDFAIPLRIQDKIFWKYFSVSNEEVGKLLRGVNLIKKEVKLPYTYIQQKIKSKDLPDKQPDLQKSTEKKPLIELKQKREKKPDIKKENFLEEVKQFLLRKDIELLEPISIEKKEIIAKVRINSTLGKIILLLVAKDKKRVAEADFTMAYQKAIQEKMPCLFVSREEPSKKTREFLAEYENIIKIDIF